MVVMVMVAQGKCRKALSDGLDLMFLNVSETFDTTYHSILFTYSTNIPYMHIMRHVLH